MKANSRNSSSASSTSFRSRREDIRRSRQRASTIKWLASLLVTAGLLALVFFVISRQNPVASGDIEGVIAYPNLDRGHSSLAVQYAQTPPVGGVHNPAWQNCGVYTEPVTNENAVHSLEHGAIWITYQPDLPAEEVQKLQELTRQSGYRLLTPYPDLPSPIVFSAWGYQLQLEKADDPRATAFIQAYEQNPQGPEPGAACTGGVGQPS